MSAQMSGHHDQLDAGLPGVLLVDVEDGAPDIPPVPAKPRCQGEVPEAGCSVGQGLHGGVGVPPPEDMLCWVLSKHMMVISE